MAGETVKVSFPGTDAKEADVLADEFRDYLSEEVDDATVDRERTDPLNQDFGATVIIVLGTPAMISLAHGVSRWIARRSEARIHLQRTDVKGNKRTITVDGQLGKRADALIRDFFTTDSK